MALSAVLFVSCQKAEDPSGGIVIDGTVAQVASYGGLVPTFSPIQLENAGVEYGDLLTVSIGDSIELIVPYVDAYSEVGSMSSCLCNYNKAGNEIVLGMSNGSFSSHIGGGEGDRFVVRMKKKGGYKSEYELLKGTYTYERSEYSSDEVFANFRELTTTALKSGVLYRSTSPISFENNKVRYVYSDSLCHRYDIKTIVDIADSDEKVREYIASPDYKGFYMKECYASCSIIGLGSNTDYIDSVYMRQMSRGLRGMIDKTGPYLIHCNEGKDRTGFYCLLLEALCGASVEEMMTDYMLTYENLYHQQKGTSKYELTWKKNGFRMLYLMSHPETWERLELIDWDNICV